MRRLAIAVGILLVLLASAAGGFAWWASREASLAWLLDRAAAASGFAVTREGLAGTLFTPIRADRLVLENDDLRIEARGVRLAWSSWRSLALDRHIEITEAALESLDVLQKRTSAARGAPPDTLALPIGVHASEIRADRVSIRIPGASTGIERLRAEYAYDRAEAVHRLRLAGAQTPIGAASGEATLGGREPFAITGTLALRNPLAAFPYEVDLAAGGELRRIGIGGAAKVDFGEVRGSAVVQPYERPLVDRILVAAENLDPRRVRRDWPEARVAIGIEGGLDAENRFHGTVRVENALAGPIDRGRLPIGRLEAKIEADAASARLTDVVATDGPNRVTGSGTLDRRNIALDLDVAALDASRIHGRVRPTRLAGRVSVAAGERMQAARGRLAEGGLALDFDASLVRDIVAVRAFRLTAGEGALSGTANVQLAGAYAFDVAGEASAFDPARLGRFPPARLSGKFDAKGTLVADARGGPRRIDGRFDLAGSSWRAFPLEGAGELVVAGERIERAQGALALAGNRIEVAGAFGAPGDTLRWTLFAPRIDALGLGVSGRASASGTATGAWSRPEIAFTVEADTIGAPRLEIGTLSASGRLEGDAGSVRLESRRLRLGDVLLARAEADVEGTLGAHRIRVTARGEAGESGAAPLFGEALAELRGALDGSRWSGRLETLTASGRVPVRLRAPASLAIEPDLVRVDSAALDALGGRLEIGRLERRGESLATEGRFASIALADVLALADRLPPGWSTDLRLGGTWTLETSANGAPAGRLSLARESGDVTVARGGAAARANRGRMGLARLEGEARIEGNRLVASARVAGDPIGTFEGSVTTRLERRGEAVGIPGTSPLEGRLTFALGSFAIARPFVDDGVSFDGAATGALTIAGTVGAPRLGGTVELARLRFALPEQGLRLRNGTATLGFDGTMVRILRARMEGEQGSVSATGELGWAGGVPAGRVDLVLERLDAITDPAYELVVSGAVSARLRDASIALAGKLRADRGVIRLPEHSTPTISSDVVIKGRARKSGETSGPRLPEADLALELGDEFDVRGRGVDVRLSGTLALKSAEGAPTRLTGTVRAARGTVSAYGQRLQIERGTLTFTGPLDNPTLNITAIRPNLPSRVGVQVTGFALEPRVALFSDTAMSDSDRLAWLVLGRSSEGLGPTDLAVLGTAAAALLGGDGAPPLTSRIAGAFGLDDISVRGSSTTANPVAGQIPTLAGTTPLDETIVSVGKRVSDKLYVSVERSLQTFTAVLRLRYQFNPRWSVQTQTGTTNTIDLFYTLSFD